MENHGHPLYVILSRIRIIYKKYLFLIACKNLISSCTRTLSKAWYLYKRVKVTGGRGNRKRSRKLIRSRSLIVAVSSHSCLLGHLQPVREMNIVITATENTSRLQHPQYIDKNNDHQRLSRETTSLDPEYAKIGSEQFALR